jgi:hypothetical protein
MAAPRSITGLIRPSEKGAGAARQRLWESYFRRLVGLARRNCVANLKPRRGGRGPQRFR